MGEGREHGKEIGRLNLINLAESEDYELLVVASAPGRGLGRGESIFRTGIYLFRKGIHEVRRCGIYEPRVEKGGALII